MQTLQSHHQAVRDGARFQPGRYWRLNEPAGSGTAINLGSALATGNAAYIANPTLQQPGAMGTDPSALFDGTSRNRQ